MRAIGGIVFVLLGIANGWFAWNTQAIFYSDEIAYAKTKAHLEEFFRDELEGIGKEVRYDGLTLTGRLKRWPGMFDELVVIYPVRTFFWHYLDGLEVKVIAVSLDSTGMASGWKGLPEEIFEDYPVYSGS